VVIADNDPIILAEIGRLLATRFDVVARAGNGRELVETVQRVSPAVVVADITMPEMNGIEAARRITKAYPGVKVVMLSVYDDPTYIEAAFEAGASGYVLKWSALKELIQAIEDVLVGRPYRPHDLR
jgi:DNA-binding NarL/FixJ family response regulator